MFRRPLGLGSGGNRRPYRLPDQGVSAWELRKHGINPDNWQRKGPALTASAVGGLLGSMMGGPLGFIVGMMGYVTAMTADYGDGEAAKERHRQYVEEALALKAGEIATEALRAHVTRQTWEAICDEVADTVKAYKTTNPSVSRTILLIQDAIARVNQSAADQWFTVYRTAERSVGL
jgi:hypothetical protein